MILRSLESYLLEECALRGHLSAGQYTAGRNYQSRSNMKKLQQLGPQD